MVDKEDNINNYSASPTLLSGEGIYLSTMETIIFNNKNNKSTMKTMRGNNENNKHPMARAPRNLNYLNRTELHGSKRF